MTKAEWAAQIEHWNCMPVVCVGTPNPYAMAAIVQSAYEADFRDYQTQRGETMNDDTTIKNNPVKLAQSELDAAWKAFESAQAAYQADRSDANLEAWKSAQEKFIRVEMETRQARQMLIAAAAQRGAVG
jgi:hypothetical protein